MAILYLPHVTAITFAIAVDLFCLGLFFWLVGRRGPGIDSLLMRRTPPWIQWVRGITRAIYIPKWVRARWVRPYITRRLRQAGTSWRSSEYAAARWGVVCVGGAASVLFLLSCSTYDTRHDHSCIDTNMDSKGRAQIPDPIEFL